MVHSAIVDQQTLERFLDLVAISATSTREKPVADFIRQRLEETDIEVTEDGAAAAVGGSTGNLICRFRGGGEIMLLSHMDTPLDTAGVQPQVHEDRITSDERTILGVDNRTGVTTLLRLLELAAADPTAYQPFTVAFTVCEETTLGGSQALEFPTGIKYAYAFDSSYRPGAFIRGSYGAMSWKMVIHGRSAHAGLSPEKGVNAIQLAARILDRLPNGRIDTETTFNVARIEGGKMSNVVPDRVTVSGEARSRNEARVESVITEARRTMESVLEQSEGSGEFAATWVFHPFTIEPDSAIVKRLTQAYARCGLTPEDHIAAGGSDANSLNARGLPALNLGVGAQNPHSTTEFILLEDLAMDLKLAQVLVGKEGAVS